MTHKAALDALREQYQNQENTLASLEAKYDGLQAEIKDMKASRQRAEESVQERFSEIALLTTRVFDLEARAKAAAASARVAETVFR
jgi:predicted nuclease with TOPRIM domain